MPDKTAASDIISLPKGGGALQGIGESFSPDLHTGTGNFSVPIGLPPGRNGFQPQLALGYSTGNGNGPFGMGWSLAIPGVSRKTSRGIPRYGDSDVFLLSGYEDLVPVAGATAGSQRYRPRTEGLFALIDRVQSPVDNYWLTRSKDGRTSYYGTPGAAGSDPAVIARPDRRSSVFAWMLTRSEDPLGNTILYSYLRDKSASDGREWDQLYLDQVRYVNYTDANGNEQFLVRVTFDYGAAEDERPDCFSDHRAGFEIRTRRRCRRVLIETLPITGVQRVRAYEFGYTRDRLNGISGLTRVDLVGYDDQGQEARDLPPLEFGYATFEPGGRRFVAMEGLELPARSLAHPDVEFVDLHGNGLPDILEMNGAVRFWRNLGGGRFDIPRAMATAPAGVSLGDPGVQLIDANGDGRSDLLVTTGPLAGYYPLEFPARWDVRSFRRYRAVPSFDLKDPEVRLIDLDGDGVTDAIRSGTRLECFFNDPDNGWTPENVRAVERGTFEDVPNVSFSDDRVKVADMSGDGLQDIVLVHDGNVEYWPNFGHGSWGTRRHMKNSPRLPANYDPKRILLGDVDGDGLADIVYVDHRGVHLWINQSGNAWSDPIAIDGAPPVTDVDSVRLADVLGNGMSGVLWSTDLGVIGPKNYFFLDFTGGNKPYLLNRMDNNLGAVRLVEYRPSTFFYSADEARRETRWRTPLPFPVHVVARLEVVDEISRGKIVTEYRYHHGYWDGAEREFRGFGMVEQLDTQSFADYNGAGLHGGDLFDGVLLKHFSPPTLTKTWFHPGPVGEEFGEWEELDWSQEYWAGDPQMLDHTASVNATLSTIARRRSRRDALRALRGNILRTELYALDGSPRQPRPYTVSENAYGLRVEADGIYFPHATSQRTTEWERGSDPMTRFSFTGDYDGLGQARRETSVACPRGWRSLADRSLEHLATRTVREYAVPTSPGASSLRDRVSKTTVYAVHGTVARTVAEIRDLSDTSSSFEIVQQTLNFYDRDTNLPENGAFVGLPYGSVGTFGIVVRSEHLVLTDAILADAYKSGAAVLAVPERPPYFDNPPTWPQEYPAAVQNQVPARAGYVRRTSGPGSPYAAGYYATTSACRCDFHVQPNGRGLVLAQRDALGAETGILHDVPYQILPARTTDPLGLQTTATYNYRTFQAQLISDANLSETEFHYSPLGLVRDTWIKGSPARTEGDRQRPSVRTEYDYQAFVGSRQPISARTIRQAHHDAATDVVPPERDESVEIREYSDGFGRLVQTRVQGDDLRFGDATFGGGESVLPLDQSAGIGGAIAGQRNTSAAQPSVVVSGWQVYDNKGRVVEKYEPFFDTGWLYSPPRNAQFGRKASSFYDPRGQVIRVVRPDGSEERTIQGVPGASTSLDALEQFVPTPWETYSYDANDNAGRTHPVQSTGYRHHWDTPRSILVDALGRTIKTVERSRARPVTTGAALGPIEEIVTTFTYDARGSLVSTTDPLGRTPFRYAYDLSGRVLRSESIDAGLRRVVFDATGGEIESRDANGAVTLRAYDRRSRLVRLWARDAANETVTLRERLIYGDEAAAGLSAAVVADSNLKGKLYLHYDEAGLQTCSRYDFKDHLVESARRVFSDAVLLSAYTPAPAGWNVNVFRADWSTVTDTILTPAASAYQTTSTYDALNRVRSTTYPADASGVRRRLVLGYTNGGNLRSVSLDADTYVELIAYTARGERAFIVYGNGIMTRLAHDPSTARVRRIQSGAFNRTGTAAPTYTPTGGQRQDLSYDYDLVGNVVAIRDRSPQSGLSATPDALDRLFSYDPLYRLERATGRECDTPPPAPPWSDTFRCSDPRAVRACTQLFSYDAAGNLTALQHVTGNNGSFTRDFVIQAGSNRVDRMRVGATDYIYTYDSSGNVARETTSRHLAWDHAGRLKTFSIKTGTAEPSIHCQYLYDAGGQRVMKLARTQGGGVEFTVYVDGFFEHQRWSEAGLAKANTRHHIMDGRSRIGLFRVGDVHLADGGPAYQLHLADHLTSSAVIVGGSSATDRAFISREEYFAYGETSFGSFSRKRYRFTGRERDEESGLAYHEARYYAPYLGRWTSCDPLGAVEGLNPYRYARSNPLTRSDTTGAQSAGGDDWSGAYNNLSLEDRAKYNYSQGLANDIVGNPAQPTKDKVAGARALNGTLTLTPPSASLPQYYSPQEQEIDAPALPWVPGSKAGWLLGDWFSGETISGHQVSRSQRLLEAGMSLAEDWAKLEMAGAGAKLLGSGSGALARGFAFKPKWSFGEPGVGSNGITDYLGNIVVRPGLPRAKFVEVLRHETVHAWLSPRYGPFVSQRAALVEWGYNKSHLLRYLEEAAAQTYGTRSLTQGLAFPITHTYGISGIRLGLEATGYVGGIGITSYGGYKLVDSLQLGSEP